MEGEQKHFDLIIPNTTPVNFGRDLAKEICAAPPPNLHDCGLRKDEIMGFLYFVIEVKRTVYFLGQEYKDKPVTVLYAEPREMTPTQIRFAGRCDNAVSDYVSSLLQRVIKVYGAQAVSPAGVAPEEMLNLPGIEV
jgi:hypothetical protein